MVCLLPSCGGDSDDGDASATTVAVPHERCLLFLHGKGGNGRETVVADGVAVISPSGNDSLGGDARQWLYFSEQDYEEAASIVRQATAGCESVIVNGFSNGGAFAAKFYCRGEDLDGRLLRVVVDDPVVDRSRARLHPEPGSRRGALLDRRPRGGRPTRSRLRRARVDVRRGDADRDRCLRRGARHRPFCRASTTSTSRTTRRPSCRNGHSRTPRPALIATLLPDVVVVVTAKPADELRAAVPRRGAARRRRRAVATRRVHRRPGVRPRRAALARTARGGDPRRRAASTAVAGRRRRQHHPRRRVHRRRRGVPARRHHARHRCRAGGRPRRGRRRARGRHRRATARERRARRGRRPGAVQRQGVDLQGVVPGDRAMARLPRRRRDGRARRVVHRRAGRRTSLPTTGRSSPRCGVASPSTDEHVFTAVHRPA